MVCLKSVLASVSVSLAIVVNLYMARALWVGEKYILILSPSLCLHKRRGNKSAMDQTKLLFKAFTFVFLLCNVLFLVALLILTNVKALPLFVTSLFWCLSIFCLYSLILFRIIVTFHGTRFASHWLMYAVIMLLLLLFLFAFIPERMICLIHKAWCDTHDDIVHVGHTMLCESSKSFFQG